MRSKVFIFYSAIIIYKFKMYSYVVVIFTYYDIIVFINALRSNTYAYKM